MLSKKQQFSLLVELKDDWRKARLTYILLQVDCLGKTN
ncbi:hypothetical protein HMPREF0650_1772 [Hoylesella buccalis ATCC 35310]|uniref:Uncharacterized protein n=1 Tax=Hoylesella buccalis ATCC 35310 TaxID=679190 RepID=D1W6G0_9BACT|nr:hypothetical protein HMPREF0650_1772 [Hoylesella buccalis ATCC 35310]